jgi:CDP-glucose 4,6-dehydratase
MVSGFSDTNDQKSVYSIARVGDFLEQDLRGDIRDFASVQNAYSEVGPDFVIHLAAQSLVRQSYLDPVSTMEVNVNGTLNVLRASQVSKHLMGQLIITTDKVYKNTGKTQGYQEGDALGGHDPYSSSKAMADILTQSWVESFDTPPTAIARAGNVIGGGDVCADRLIPDLISSYSSGLTPKLRAPNSVRPWQHVLDCLNGYLTLVDALIDKNAHGAWNFGPDEKQSKTVAQVADIAGGAWGAQKSWENDLGNHPHEASLLMLNSSEARTELGWSDKLSFEESVKWTIDWYKNVYDGNDPLEETLKNIKSFEAK